MKDNLRSSLIFGDRAFDAKHSDSRNIPDTGFVPLPNDSSERFVGIGFIEVDEGSAPRDVVAVWISEILPHTVPSSPRCLVASEAGMFCVQAKRRKQKRQ